MVGVEPTSRKPTASNVKQAYQKRNKMSRTNFDLG